MLPPMADAAIVWQSFPVPGRLPGAGVQADLDPGLCGSLAESSPWAPAKPASAQMAVLASGRERTPALDGRSGQGGS